MVPVEVGAFVLVLLASVGIGTVCHELAHAVVLRAFRVPHDVEFLPGRGSAGPLRAGLVGTWALVTPRDVPSELPDWGLRLSAMMPFVLATPLLLVPLGVVPDPFDLGNRYLVAATIGWIACSLPSPRDFSVLWYADRIVEGERESRERSS